MMNLFSSFNPITTSSTSLNWAAICIPTSMIINSYWALWSTSLSPYKKFIKTMVNQFKPSMNMSNYSNMIIILMIMLMIFIYNLVGLLPNTFSITSHIMMNLSLALTIWMTLLINKLFQFKNFMTHLTPSSTPSLLIPFMVMIELMSLMIQPITLSIRLTANITAGHIMMILISHLYTLTMLPTLILNLMMMTLEMTVTLIQAYVFSMLIIMYMK